VRFVGSSDRDRARPTVPHDVRFEEAQHGEGSAESRVECVVRGAAVRTSDWEGPYSHDRRVRLRQ
jgi:hypothetical protein